MRAKIRIVTRVLAILATLAVVAAPSRAGTGQYDPKTRSFSLTYIYLDLPSGVNQEAQVLSTRGASRPDAQQAQDVQRFWKAVSDTLFQVTAGRARIGDLRETQDIAKADAVVSLTGSVKMLGYGGAWAVPLGWSTPSATLNLYYQDLVDNKSADVTQTVVHELLHYFVGLPDEYPSGSSAPLCPTTSPGGVRCLMDNFHYGWNGRLCTRTDHNPAAPGASGSSVVTDPNTSCQEILDKFFADRGVTIDPNAVNPGVAAGAGAGNAPLPPLPAGMKETVLGKARDEVTRIKSRRGLLKPEDRARIKGFILSSLADFVKTAGGAKPTNIGGYAEKLTSELLLTSLGVPPGLSLIEPLIKAEAGRLAKLFLGQKGAATSIQTELTKFAQGKIQGMAGAPPLGVDDFKYLGELSKQAAAGNDVTAPETPARLEMELQREMYQTLMDIANQVGLPGAGARRDNFNRIIGELEKAGVIPDRSLGNRFGRRKTVVIEPPILLPIPSGYTVATEDAKVFMDNVETQGYKATDERSNYNLLRQTALLQFAKLIDRNRVDILTATRSTAGGVVDNGAGVGVFQQGLIEAGPTPFDAANAMGVFGFDYRQGRFETPQGRLEPRRDPGLIQGVLDARKARIATSMARIRDQIERDQIENIVLLVPPGGLPDDFGDALMSLRDQFLDKTDLRLDIALVGSAWIPDALRDVVTRTKGSIMTVTDIDEVGSVVQRLAGQQTQGTWVTIPQQDYLLVDAAAPGFDIKGRKEDDPNFEVEGTLYKRLRGMRKPHPVKSDGDSLVVLKPFYVDTATNYQLIVDLTQPLTIAGLSPRDDAPAPAMAPATPPPPPAPGGANTGATPATPTPPPTPTPAANPTAPASQMPISGSAGNLAAFPLPTIRLLPGQVRDTDAIRAMEGRAADMVFVPTPNLRLSLEKSSPTILVFELPVGTQPGWYNPVLKLSGGNFKQAATVAGSTTGVTSGAKRAYRNDVIHFTFSVGTQTSKAQMVASLMQDAPRDSTTTDQGTVTGDHADLAAVLTAGAAVVGADVVGYIQRIDEGVDAIPTETVTFNDQGVVPDKVAGDGIYSARVPLATRRERRTEYRVFVEGRSIQDRTRFVPAGELGLTVPGATPPPVPAGAAQPTATQKAPAFQRATSVDFNVPAAGGR